MVTQIPVRSARGALRVVSFALGLMASGVDMAVAGPLAVIVSKENQTEELSFLELVKIFKQEKQYWNHGEKIYLLMRESDAPEKFLLLQKVYRMEDKRLKRYWLAKLYRGEITALPKTLGSNEAVKRFVSQAPNAVGVIDASYVDSTVKVLAIDGRRPGEMGYALGEGF